MARDTVKWRARFEARKGAVGKMQSTTSQGPCDAEKAANLSLGICGDLEPSGGGGAASVTGRWSIRRTE
jgi:hypothetical protein